MYKSDKNNENCVYRGWQLYLLTNLIGIVVLFPDVETRSSSNGASYFRTIDREGNVKRKRKKKNVKSQVSTAGKWEIKNVYHATDLSFLLLVRLGS